MGFWLCGIWCFRWGGIEGEKSVGFMLRKWPRWVVGGANEQVSRTFGCWLQQNRMVEVILSVQESDESEVCTHTAKALQPIEQAIGSHGHLSEYVAERILLGHPELLSRHCNRSLRSIPFIIMKAQLVISQGGFCASRQQRSGESVSTWDNLSIQIHCHWTISRHNQY